tara:strand:- start:65549 stop:67075 length:1527 start_codon:yes stop_codon:yes gene_type:complete
MKKLIFIFSFFISISFFAQTPCLNGFAGIYPCKGYDLLSHTSPNILVNPFLRSSGTPTGRDLWGWVDSGTGAEVTDVWGWTDSGREYAIVATTASTAFIDVTDPINPIYLGRVDTQSSHTGTWRDVKIYGNTAYIVANRIGLHAMQVFDLTRLRGPKGSTPSPQVFIPDLNYFNVGNGCDNVIINESKPFAYLVGCRFVSIDGVLDTSGGPVFLDLSNPLLPVSLGNYPDDGYIVDAQVVTYNGPDTDYTGREILIGSNVDKVVILDVTDKSFVRKISEISYSQVGYTHQGWLTEDHRYFIAGDELDEERFGINTRTFIFDFQDLDNPVLSSTYSGASKAIDFNGYVKGNEFFLASLRAGMRTFDLTNIGAATNSLVETGYFDTYPNDDDTEFDGVRSVYPYLPSGNILIADTQGLFIIRKNGTLGAPDEIFKNEFSISPNPTESNPIIRALQNTQIKTIDVYSVLGKKIFSKQDINQNQFVLPMENQAKGIYFVKINKVISTKLIIR